MLSTNTQINSITAKLSKFVKRQKKFFKGDNLDFLQTRLNTATLIFDLCMALGLPETDIRQILGDDVVDEIA